jgi:cytoskeletal protein RodZ
LSQEEVSQRTKIELGKVNALEANQFEQLPEGTDLDSLIRAYATEVGLDGGELLSRFHSDHIVVVPTAVTDEFSSEYETDETVGQAPLHGEDDDPRVLPAPSEVGIAAAAPAAIPIAADEISYSAPPLRPEAHLLRAESGIFADRVTPPPRARLSRLALPVIALLAAVAIGAYLYDRNRPFTEREDIETPAVSSDASGATGASGASSASGASGASGPSGASSASGAGASDPSSASGAPDPSSASGVSGASGANREAASATGTKREGPSPAARSSRPAPSARSEPGASSSAAGGATEDRPASPANATNARGAERVAIAGFWTLDTRVEASSVRDFEGLQLGYRLELQQDGSRVSGRGIKTIENGKTIGSRGQTPITVVGRIEKNRLMLSFIESGSQRESAGKMILELHEDGVLRGRFSSDAARSTGTVEARRPEG